MASLWLQSYTLDIHEFPRIRSVVSYSVRRNTSTAVGEAARIEEIESGSGCRYTPRYLRATLTSSAIIHIDASRGRRDRNGSSWDAPVDEYRKNIMSLL